MVNATLICAFQGSDGRSWILIQVDYPGCPSGYEAYEEQDDGTDRMIACFASRAIAIDWFIAMMAYRLKK
jgi:hypothetical protein